VALVVFAIALMLGSARVIVARAAQADALQKSVEGQRKVFVAYTVGTPGGSDGSAQVMLPGTLQGRQETAVYSRSNGYVRRWLRDIGAHVNAGELIAEIETPELDQQLAQSSAVAQQTELNLGLARQTLKRWEALRKDDLVTQQEVEERRASVDQLGAALAAAQADVARIAALGSFQHVRAPFAGVITRRNVEQGSLVNAGNGGPAQALFLLASTDHLRLEIYVPQAYANRVKLGMPVDVTQAELPGEHFRGKIARTTGAIDSTTRTLQVEVEIPNRDGRLLPGAYVSAGLPLARGAALTVPANTLLFRAEGPRLVIVDDHGRVRLSPISLGRDLGKTIEIVAGLATSDHVILNPPDALADGDSVDARPVPAAPDAGAQAKPFAGNPQSGGASTGKVPEATLPGASQVK
jgi:RND family efflux transporter MFP subunit